MSTADPIDEVLADGLTATGFFGTNPKRARNRYLRYARLVHPDLTDDGRAGEAAARLNVLWEEYTASAASGGAGAHANGHGHAGRGKRTPRTVFRTDKLAFLADDGDWLVVRRAPATPFGDGPDDAALARLRELVAGTPVRIGSVAGTVAIAQSDGPHMALRVDDGDVPGQVFGLATLTSAAAHEGILDGRDIAWMFKRLLFLAGALNEAGLGADHLFGQLAVNPDAHTITLVNPMALGSDADADNVRPLATDFHRLITGPDSRSRIDGRLEAFIRGCTFDGPAAGELLGEFDGVLEGLYGRPRFHRMRIPAGLA